MIRISFDSKENGRDTSSAIDFHSLTETARQIIMVSIRAGRKAGRRLVSETPGIVVIDDEPEIAELLGIYLRNEGYRVFTADNGSTGLAVIEKESIQLAILDIMMPHMDGISVCTKIRETSDIPIIMLSAKSREMDKILGLGVGADDYIGKPFNVLEVMARVKSHLRRYLGGVTRSAQPSTVTVGDLTVDPARHEVRIGARAVELTPKEFDILLLLARHPGRVFSSEEIFTTVWGERCYDSGNTVMVHVRKIRSKIEEDPSRPRIVRTVWGVGYRIDE
jgi:two-component system, OmpR family, response regulator VanR